MRAVERFVWGVAFVMAANLAACDSSSGAGEPAGDLAAGDVAPTPDTPAVPDQPAGPDLGPGGDAAAPGDVPDKPDQLPDTPAEPDAPTNPDLTPDTPAPPDVPVTPDTPATPDLTPDLGGPPAGHSESMGGVFHMSGMNDPLRNCTGCHGATLRGGAGPSCYTCHNTADHTLSERGVRHKSGPRTTCNVCHGPNNAGGLGPACNECH